LRLGCMKCLPAGVNTIRQVGFLDAPERKHIFDLLLLLSDARALNPD
jgi:hypothetical protein